MPLVGKSSELLKSRIEKKTTKWSFSGSNPA
jgi:hypothetical protein